jgi:hypothetical protein
MQGRAMDLSPDALAEYALADRRVEYRALANAVARMVLCQTLPPNDAYAWTVIVARMARAVGLIEQGES